jgi:hypothetical protein
MAASRARNGFWFGKISQALIDFQQNHQPKLLRWSTRSRCDKRDICRREGVNRTQFFDRWWTTKTRIGGSFNGLSSLVKSYLSVLAQVS